MFTNDNKIVFLKNNVYLTHDSVWRGRGLVPGAEESNVPLVEVPQHAQAGQVLMMKILW